MSTEAYRIKRVTGTWDVVVGLKVYAQVTSRAKLFGDGSGRVRVTAFNSAS